MLILDSYEMIKMYRTHHTEHQLSTVRGNLNATCPTPHLLNLHDMQGRRPGRRRFIRTCACGSYQEAGQKKDSQFIRHNCPE